MSVQILQFQLTVMVIANYVLLGVKIWAFVDALMRPKEAFVAADKLTKPAWSLITGLAAAAALFSSSPFGLLSIVGTVAAFVYILDVRPALSSVTRRR